MEIFDNVSSSYGYNGFFLGQVDIWAEPVEVGDFAAANAHVGVDHYDEALPLAWSESL